MEKYRLRFSDQVEDDIKRHKNSGDKISFNKIKILLKELAEHPRTGTGHPEQLKGYSNRWSRRVTKKHRLVYEIEEDIVTVLILTAYGHYDDK